MQTTLTLHINMVVRVARLVLGMYFVMQTTLTLHINMVVRVARLVLGVYFVMQITLTLPINMVVCVARLVLGMYFVNLISLIVWLCWIFFNSSFLILKFITFANSIFFRNSRKIR